MIGPLLEGLATWRLPKSIEDDMAGRRECLAAAPVPGPSAPVPLPEATEDARDFLVGFIKEEPVERECVGVMVKEVEEGDMLEGRRRDPSPSSTSTEAEDTEGLLLLEAEEGAV